MVSIPFHFPEIECDYGGYFMKRGMFWEYEYDVVCCLECYGEELFDVRENVGEERERGIFSRFEVGGMEVE